MRRIAAFLFIPLLAVLIGTSLASAAPIMVDNATAEILPKGKWDAEFHYAYYPVTWVKNTAYYGYKKGDGKMERMGKMNMFFTSQVYLSELYYAVTDTLLVGGVFPYLAREIKKQAFAKNEKVSSDGVGDCALRGCLNLLDPAKNYFGAAIGGAIKFPSGNEDFDPPVGSGRYDFSGAFVLTKIFNEKFKTHVTLCYTIPTRNKGYRYWNMYSEVQTGNVFHYGVVADYALTKRFNLLFEVNGWMAPDSRDKNNDRILYTGYSKVDLVPGIQFKVRKNVTLEAALQIAVKKDGDFDYDVAPVFGVVAVF
jgi:hypothetical protein